MLIEIAGCSGTGKTTLAQRVAARLSEHGDSVAHSSNLVARATGTTWCKNERLRNLLVNLVLTRRCALLMATNRPLVKFSLSRIGLLGRGLIERISRIRSTMRILACDSILRDHTVGAQLTIVDEGVIGCMHNLFAFPYADAMPSAESVHTYLALAPAPDLLVLVDAPFEVVLDRTLSRADPPLRLGKKNERISAFLANGLAAFSEIRTYTPYQKRILCVHNSGQSLDSLTSTIVDFVVAKMEQNGKQ
ncbi:MAG: hypothetical protein MK102_15475 [Fuerstiella sp.]|nr:hypothetical protein [Fuerstiella sp.]